MFLKSNASQTASAPITRQPTADQLEKRETALSAATVESRMRQSQASFLRSARERDQYYNPNAMSHYSRLINPGGGRPSAFEVSQNVLAMTDRNYTPDMAGLVAARRASERAHRAEESCCWGMCIR